MLQKNRFFALLAVLACLGLSFGCDTGASNGSPSGSTHTYADASKSMTTYSNGLLAASSHINGSGSAYCTVDGMTYIIVLDNYIDSTNGVAVSGTLTETLSPLNINGTLTFTGGDVTQIIFNNATGTSGTLTIKFSDNSSWTYNYATGAFTGL